MMNDRFFNATVYPSLTTSLAAIIIGGNIIDRSRIQHEIYRLYSKNISMTFIGIGDEVDVDLLRQLATNSSFDPPPDNEVITMFILLSFAIDIV